MMTNRNWRASFNDVFEGPESAIAARVFRDVLGDEYPEVLDPHSYVTWSQLHRIVSEVNRTGRGMTRTPPNRPAATAQWNRYPV